LDQKGISFDADDRQDGESGRQYRRVLNQSNGRTIVAEDWATAEAFPNTGTGPSTGLTVREYFAAAALQGILASAGWQRQSGEVIKLAIKFADEMIERLSEEH
jgi:hypothetical protein